MLKGQLAGPLFENFCIAGTIKLFFNRGRRGNLFYLRTNNNLEADLLTEESFATVMPVQISLNQMLNMQMGSNITRFKDLFSKLKVNDGRIMSLTEKSIPLSRDVSVVTLNEYLKQVAKGFQ